MFTVDPCVVQSTAIGDVNRMGHSGQHTRMHGSNDECPPQAKRMELMNLHGTEKIISGEQAVAHFAACLVQKSCVKVCL